MAKKAKLNYGKADDHNFFAKHVEKLIFAAVGLIVAFFVYSGFSIEGLDSSKTPDNLRQQANGARDKLGRTQWDDVKDQEDRVVLDLTRRLETKGTSLVATDPVAYASHLDWNARLFSQKGKRADPPLLPPEQLEVVAGYGPLAMMGSMAKDQLMTIAMAAKKTADEEAKKKAAKKKPEEAGYPGYGSGYASSGEAGMEGGAGSSYGEGYGMTAGYGATASSGPRATPEQLENVPGYRPNSGGAGGGYGGMSGGSGGESAYMGGSGAEGSGYGYGAGSTEAASSGAEGYGAAGYGAGGYGGAATGVIPQGKYYIAVKALVPYKTQWSEFEHTFQDSYDYNMARDIPQYFYYQVERVEVDEAGQPIEGEVKTWTPDTAQWYQRNWYAGTPEPIVDPAYFDRLLTNACPPIMMRDLEPLQLHSKTPKRQILALAPKKAPTKTDAAPPTAKDGEIGPRPRPGMQSPYGGASGYGSGAAGYGAAGYGAAGYGAAGYGAGGYEASAGYGAEAAYGSSGYGEGASGAMPGYGAAGYGAGGYGESGAASGYGESGYGAGYGAEAGYGSGSGSGYGMGGYGAAGPRMAGPSVDYKLFRFYDFMVEPGKQYKYRVKLFLVDPNHPQDPRMAPPVAYLEDDVITRIKAVDTKDAEQSQTTGQPSRTYWLETEWSEWSQETSIPPQYDIVAGPVTPERATLVDRERGIEVPEPGSEPEANVLAMVWDHEKSADIPGQRASVRGSVLNFTAKANVLHPVSLQVLPLPDYKFATDVMILDIRGGTPLPTTLPAAERAEISHNAPGEVLVIEASGKMVVQNELDDILTYNNNIFKEPEKPKTPSPQEGAYPGYGGDAGAPGYGSGYPGGGAGGGGRPRRGRGGSSSSGS
jgi:hypothetical protein